MKFLFAIDDDCPVRLRSAFFEALRDSSVRRLADEAAQTAARLSSEFGRLAEIRQAVLLVEATGTSVADTLRERISDLKSQRVGMQQAVADLKHFEAQQKDRVKSERARCAEVLLDGPRKVEDLRRRIRNYEQDREAVVERLRGVGLDDDAIQRVGIKPSPDDLAAWPREIKAVERDVRLAQAFLDSAPLYDAELPRGGV